MMIVSCLVGKLGEARCEGWISKDVDSDRRDGVHVGVAGVVGEAGEVVPTGDAGDHLAVGEMGSCLGSTTNAVAPMLSLDSALKSSGRWRHHAHRRLRSVLSDGEGGCGG